MKILVCLSNVPDTTTKIRFKENNTAFDAAGVQWIINPWDELALTRAMDLKEDGGNAVSEVVAASVGLADCEPTLRKALAIGADKAIRVNAEPKDAYSVAANLAEYIKSESFDIILCGIESSDYNGSMVGGILAEFLELPSVSSVSELLIEGDSVTLKREIDGGSEALGVQLPAVAVVQKGIAINPRIPSMRGIMMARQKPLNVVEGAGTEALMSNMSYEMPPPKPPCKMVDPENAKELIGLLQNEAKVI